MNRRQLLAAGAGAATMGPQVAKTALGMNADVSEHLAIEADTLPDIVCEEPTFAETAARQFLDRAHDRDQALKALRVEARIGAISIKRSWSEVFKLHAVIEYKMAEWDRSRDFCHAWDMSPEEILKEAIKRGFKPAPSR